jgi:hypothetical protein
MSRTGGRNYCKKVPLPEKVTQRITDLSQKAAAFAGVLSIAAGKWHENVHFGAKAAIALFYPY